MTRPTTDRELLEHTWRRYDEAFAAHVGDVVTPDEHVEAEAHVDWGAQVFMFGYALGSIAGAQAVDPDSIERAVDSARVADIVDTVIDIAEGDGIPVSSSTVKDDFRGD